MERKLMDDRLALSAERASLLPSIYKPARVKVSIHKAAPPARLAIWLQNQPAARLGLAVATLGIGALLSRKALRGRRKVELQTAVCEPQPGEQIVIAVLFQHVIVKPGSFYQRLKG